MPQNKKYTREEFITKVKSIHGDKYDYTNTKYSSLGTTVEVYCKEHGVFHIQAVSLLSPKGGCPKCKKSSKILSKADLLQRFTKKFGDKFDYSRVPDRVRFKEFIEIGCPIHGWFTQEVRVHAGLSTHGCQRCANTAKSLALSKQISTKPKVPKVPKLIIPVSKLSWKPTNV